MIKGLKILLKYLKYKLTSKHYKKCGISSRFVYDFVEKAIFGEDVTCSENIENLRRKLLASKMVLNVDDFGAGSRAGMKDKRIIGDVVRHTAIKPKYGRLLSRMVNYLEPGVVVELGTGLGFSTMYMAVGNKNRKIITVEGSKEIAAMALQNFQETGVRNICLLTGTFGGKIPQIIDHIDDYPLLFIDGDHRKEKVIRYVELWLSAWNGENVIVLDDIHWSDEMEEAWKYIIKKPEVSFGLDLFQLGIIFIRKGWSEQHYVIRF